jgi:hypothetical protein
MQSISGLRNTVNLSESDIEALPNHKRKSSKEWSSACPSCSGKDRFLFWPDKGNFWCRQCNLSGFTGSDTRSDLTEIQIADIERRKRQAHQAEADKKRTALERLQRKRNDIVYHRNLNGNSKYVQEKWGVTDTTIDDFKIGYCHACPTSSYSDSITIPYYWHGNLINLRHRLSNPNGQGKYRPEMAGLPTAIFNADILAEDTDGHIVIVEGEFKTMVLNQYGIPAIGIPGASIFKEKWINLFPKNKAIFVTLDPGAEAQGIKLGKTLSSARLSVQLASLPVKPDDFFVLYGGTYDQFYGYLANGRAM